MKTDIYKIKKISIIIIFIFAYIFNFSYKVYAQVFDPSSPVSSDYLKNTTLTPVMDAKIEKGKNLLFCSTFQMAWNKICKDIIGGPLNVVDPPWYATPLNKLIDQPALLSEDAYFSMAGLKKDDIVEKINKGLREKFGHLKEAGLVTVNDNLKYPNDIMAFAYLYKKLEYAVPFKKMGPLKVNDDEDVKNISTFGFGQNYNDSDNEDNDKLIKQLKLLYYNCDEGFIFELKTKSETDELIISTLSPELTLDKTYNKIIECIEQNKKNDLNIVHNNNEPISSHLDKDTKIYNIKALRIPCIKFNILHAYNGLTNKVITSKFSESIIDAAIQKIDFSLNEKGSKLISYAFLTSVTGLPSPYEISLHVKPPFIVLLKCRDKAAPYFMAYIANGELLETDATVSISMTNISEAILQRHSPKTIQKMIEKGFDVNAKNKFGQTALEAAIFVENVDGTDNYELIKLLFNNKIDVSSCGQKVLLDIVYKSHCKLYSLLTRIYKNTKFKFDDNIFKNHNFYKFISIINLMKVPEAKKNILETSDKIKWILNSKVNELNMNELLLNFFNLNDIIICEEYIEILVNYGANVNQKNDKGDTILIWSIKNNLKKDFIMKLIDKGADVKATDKNGHDAIYYAKENKMDDVVKLLTAK